MKQPKFIKDGALISCVAPSFGVTFSPYKERYEKSIQNLKKLGYKIEEGENVHLNEGLLSSNTAIKRAEEFNSAYLKKNDVIFSVGGGEFMDEILPYVDFKKINKEEPKWFVGYSDNTVLTFTLTTICNVISIYGPCITTFFEKPLRLSELNTLKMLQGCKHFEGYKHYSNEVKDDENPFHRLELKNKKIITAKNYTEPFTGILLGGCLDLLINIVGTKYDNVKKFINNQNEKIIWFIESCDLSLNAIRRGLFQLKEAGWFNNCSGFIIGRENKGPLFYSGIEKEDAYKMLEELQVPILLDCDIGHIPPILPIKCGAKCTVTYQNNNIIMDYLE